MRYMTIEEINRAAADPLAFIETCEAEYELLLQNAARQILKTSEEKPIMLLSGPSGSGKTTSALRIEALLESWGHRCHTLSMDNYYYRDDSLGIPVDDEGEPDLESPLIVDGPLLRTHIEGLIRGETVEIPSFDFVAQQRRPQRTPMTRRKGELVVIEGIHALNPLVVGDAHAWGTGIYVSVRTRVKDPNGFVLHPSKVRLLRRLMRDRRGRGQSFEDTVQRARSVNRGERLYIMPHKIHADISIDSFCPYELPVYRDILLDGLLAMDPMFMEDYDVSDMAPMLKQVTPMAMEGIRREALIREFIGGGIA